MLACMAAVILTLTVIGLLISSHPSSAPKISTKTPEPLTTTSSLPENSVSMSLADATTLVEEARQLMLEARWDEAEERLATIPSELFSDSGATTAMLELEDSRTRYMELTEQFNTAIKGEDWKLADQLFHQLQQIALPNNSLALAHDTAHMKLQNARTNDHPDPQANADSSASAQPPKKNTGTSSTTASTNSSASKPRPHAQGQTNPASGATTTGGGTTSGASTVSNSTAESAGTGDETLTLSPEQQAALDAALAQIQ